MSKARLVITAVIAEKRPVSEVARSYGVARSWIYALLARCQAEGEAAFEPRSRRPKTSPAAIPDATAGLIVVVRKELAGQGLDAGPHTIAWHLQHHHGIKVSPATISRYLAARGLVVPEPRKRPKSSYIRFAAEQPNECWQSDFTHYPLADGTGTEILTWLDDHSRLALSVTAHHHVTGQIVLASFRDAVAAHGPPASTLTDNGLVFTTRLAGGKGGRNALETELRRLGITQKNGRPNHPQTQGKAERFQQALKKWLAAQPCQPATLARLQALLDAFTGTYNTRRPHRSLEHRATPATAYAARPRATPGDRTADARDRLRRDRIDANGTVTLRAHGRLLHIGIGRTHAGTHVLLLIHDLHVRVINAATGELLRELHIDPARDYQPTGRPRGPQKKTPRPNAGSGCPRCPATSHGRDGGIRTRGLLLPKQAR
jgi:transposase InsO family protein